jgi:hypothetical protein
VAVSFIGKKGVILIWMKKNNVAVSFIGKKGVNFTNMDEEN